MKEWLEYAAVTLIVKGLGTLPRSAARSSAVVVMRFCYALLPRLRKTAQINLQIAFPDWNEAQRKAVIRGMLRNLGWMAADFACFARYTWQNIDRFVVLDGHEDFLDAQTRGKVVLQLTRPGSAREVSSFA